MKKAFVLVFLAACGAPQPMTTGTGGGSGAAGGTGGTAGGTGGNAGGTASGTALSVSECETDMQRFADAMCTDAAQWTMAKTVVCPKLPNTTSAPCAAALEKAKTCHAQFQSATIGCVLGQTDSADPCAVDVLLGVFCAASVNSNLCMATQCMYSTDCPTNYSCNDKTRRCFKTDAPCLGLPCKYSTDCPTGYTCNNAIEQCVRQ